MADIKISELQPTTDLEGLYTIGSDKNNLSKKVSLQFLREAADYAIEQGDYAKREGDTIESRITDFKAETDVKLTELESEVKGDISTQATLVYNYAYISQNGSITQAGNNGKVVKIPVKEGVQYILKSSFGVSTTGLKFRNYAFYSSNPSVSSYITGGTLHESPYINEDDTITIIAPRGAKYMAIHHSDSLSIYQVIATDNLPLQLNNTELETKGVRVTDTAITSTNLISAIRKIRIVPLTKETANYKLLQTGYSTAAGYENKIMMYLIDEDGTIYSFTAAAPNRTGVQTYSAYNDKVFYCLTIDWDVYNQYFSNRYVPNNSNYGTGGIYVTGVNDSNSLKVPTMESHLKEMNDGLGIVVGDTESVRIKAFEQSATSGFLYGYVLYNKPFERDGVIKGISTSVYAHSIDIMELQLFVGTFDQRNTIVNPRFFNIKLADLGLTSSSTSVSLDLSSYGIKVNKGEVLGFFSRSTNYQTAFLIATNGNASSMVYTSTSIGGTFVETTEFAKLYIDVLYYDELFVSKSKGEEIKTEIASINASISTSSILYDKITNLPYKIEIVDGQISVRSLNYKKALFFGSSFVAFGVSEESGWYSNSALAPSVAQHSLPNLVLEGLRERNADATMVIASSYNWERNFDTFDFDSEWKSLLQNTNPDVIFMHISGNSTWSNTFKAACERMIRYVKTTCPNSDILIAASWHGGQKAIDMQAACIAEHITYVDLSDLKNQQNMWKAGDWHLGDDGEYHGIPTGLATHPNDMGCIEQANRYLSLSASKTLEPKIHYININKTGEGIISTPNTSWVENGIVTLRIERGEISSLEIKTSSGISVAATKRSNGLNEAYNIYYTFTMPNEDVNINVVFVA